MFKITKYVCLALWGLFILGLLVGGGVLWAISSGYIGEMPSIEELENPQSKYATIVYSADSVELGRFSRAKENRVFINYNELSPNLINALVATEDARFLDHSGIDIKALFRAAFKTVLLHQRSAGGGSTITQQLAKQVYTKEVASNIWERAMQKPIEWVIAVKLEKLYTKEEIINMYLNHFDFCYNAVGIRSAARFYFDKLPSELTIEEAATLVGMVNKPTRYNPALNPERALERRNFVIGRMAKNRYISKAVADSVSKLPINLVYQVRDHNAGLAPYFRDLLRRDMNAEKPKRSNYQYPEDYTADSLRWRDDELYGWLNKNRKPGGEKYNLDKDGLRIYTTINYRMQQNAEQAVAEHL